MKRDNNDDGQMQLQNQNQNQGGGNQQGGGPPNKRNRRNDDQVRLLIPSRVSCDFISISIFFWILNILISLI